jgi:hypothetical protein
VRDNPPASAIPTVCWSSLGVDNATSPLAHHPKSRAKSGRRLLQSQMQHACGSGCRHIPGRQTVTHMLTWLPARTRTVLRTQRETHLGILVGWLAAIVADWLGSRTPYFLLGCCRGAHLQADREAKNLHGMDELGNEAREIMPL